MRRVVLLVCAIFLVGAFASKAMAEPQASITLKEEREAQERINKIGFRILNANRLENRVVFYYDNRSKLKSFAYTGLMKSRNVVVYRSVFSHCETEDELAAILSREISNSMNSYNGIMRGSFYPILKMVSLRKQEYKADKRAVDFMVDAGYNPVALIVIMNKIAGQYRYEIWGPSPLTSRRMIEVYEYIYKKYPYFLANNSYKNNLYYQNFLLTSAQNRDKFKEKLESDKVIKVNYR